MFCVVFKSSLHLTWDSNSRLGDQESCAPPTERARRPRAALSMRATRWCPDRKKCLQKTRGKILKVEKERWGRRNLGQGQALPVGCHRAARGKVLYLWHLALKFVSVQGGEHAVDRGQREGQRPSSNNTETTKCRSHSAVYLHTLAPHHLSKKLRTLKKSLGLVHGSLR